jgi:antitoxin component of MazEF toxin-antitoxin module
MSKAAVVKIWRVGREKRSMCTIIPAELAKILGLEEGDIMAVSLSDDRLVFQKVALPE